MRTFNFLLINWTLIIYSIIILLKNNQIYGFLIPDTEKCRYLRVEKMLKARCNDMKLKDVPQYLSGNVEVLDLSYNRIKKLKKTSFQRYKDIRYLLLYENMIHIIEQDTFSQLYSLEEIDLSNNALLTIPLELFNLPSLRNLYVDSNYLVHLQDDLINLERPIKAPLEYLNIADCELKDIPYLGILPRLWHLNASMNPLNEITVQKFSPLCHLKSVDLDKTLIPYCSCQFIMMYFSMRKIKAHNYFCDTNKSLDELSCQDTSNYTIFDEDFDNCSAVIITTKIQITWIAIVAIAGFGMIILMGLILCINKRKNRKKSKKLALKNTSNGATTSNVKNLDRHLLGNP